MSLSRALLDRIAIAHGSSYYLLDSGRFRNNFNRLTEAFRYYYPNTSIAYSYKTNYIPRLCQIVDQMGGLAEVVSSMELELAMRIGVKPERIFLNGPFKEEAAMRTLLTAGGTVNLDSIDELNRIAELASNHRGNVFKLGLRCNFDVQDGVHSRFGFDVNAPEFSNAINLIDNHPMLRLTGLHCHFATRNIESWQHRTAGILKVIHSHFKHRLDDLLHISLGGGLYGPMTDSLKAQFSTPVPTFTDYAGAAAKLIAEYFGSARPLHSPLLIIEPGTALAADSMRFVCQVHSVKQIRGKTIISLSGSAYNINPNPNRKNVPIECFADPNSTGSTEVKDADMAGYTCIESDYLYKGFSGAIAPGDFIVFDCVGSYSIVMKPPFILPNVSVLELSDDDLEFHVVKRREGFDDIFNTYSF